MATTTPRRRRRMTSGTPMEVRELVAAAQAKSIPRALRETVERVAELDAEYRQTIAQAKEAQRELQTIARVDDRAAAQAVARGEALPERREPALRAHATDLSQRAEAARIATWHAYWEAEDQLADTREAWLPKQRAATERAMQAVRDAATALDQALATLETERGVLTWLAPPTSGPRPTRLRPPVAPGSPREVIPVLVDHAAQVTAHAAGAGLEPTADQTATRAAATNNRRGRPGFGL